MLVVLEFVVVDVLFGVLVLDIECILVWIWLVVIGGSVGCDSDFFDIGGNLLFVM